MIGTLGGPELVLILVIALIVFGPRKLPDIGKSVGKMMVEFRKASTDFKRTIEQEVEAERHKPRMVSGEAKTQPTPAPPPSPAPAESGAVPSQEPPQAPEPRPPEEGHPTPREASAGDPVPATGPAEPAPSPPTEADAGEGRPDTP